MSNFLKNIKNNPFFFNIYKAFLNFLFLLLVYFSNFSSIFILIFAFFVIKFYFSFSEGIKNIKFSYWILNFFILFLLYYKKDYALFIFFVYLVLMFFIWWFLNTSLLNKRKVYYIFSALFYVFSLGVCFLFFPSLENSNFFLLFLWLNFIFWVFYFLMKEFWVNNGLGLKQKEKFWSVVSSLIILEFFLVLRFLPLDFIMGALGITFFILILRDIYLAYEKGFLNINFVFRQLVLFILFLSALFLLNNWSVN
jgi:hypothetical protein